MNYAISADDKTFYNYASKQLKPSRSLVRILRLLNQSGKVIVTSCHNRTAREGINISTIATDDTYTDFIYQVYSKLIQDKAMLVYNDVSISFGKSIARLALAEKPHLISSLRITVHVSKGSDSYHDQYLERIIVIEECLERIINELDN